MSKQSFFIIDPANTNPDVSDRRPWHGLDFVIRAMSKEDVRRVQSQANEYIAEHNIDDQVEQDRIRDQYYLDRLLMDWRGPVTPDRQKLPLTPANKFALVNAMPGLLVWLTGESADIARHHYIKTEGDLGNSEPGRPGSPTDPGAKTANS